MTRRWITGLALVAGIALLPACSSSGDDDTAAGSTATASIAATSTPASSSATGTASAPAAASPAAGSPAGRICAFLGQQQAAVASAKSPADAKAVLTINLATFASQNADLREAVNSDLDALTTQGCASTRSALLTKLGADSFSAALGLS